jgi:hypothetical protein
MDYEQIESSQRQHFEVIEHQERLNLIMQQQEYNLFSMLKPKLYVDGNEWCCLLGDDIQSGICGFGDTPYKAIHDFNKQSTP